MTWLDYQPLKMKSVDLSIQRLLMLFPIKLGFGFHAQVKNKVTSLKRT